VIEDLPADETFRGRELTVAKQLVESMTTRWDPANYRDTYRKRVEDLIKRKQRGEEIVTEGGGAPEDSNVSDLMDALRRSAEEMRGRSGKPAPASKPKTAAKRKPKAKSRSGRKAG
jgi:DNA end-binding protein Ku